MGEEHRDLLEDGGTPAPGLFPRRGNADNDIAEHRARELAELSFVHRERQDVGRTILMAIDLVQLMHSLVVS